MAKKWAFNLDGKRVALETGWDLARTKATVGKRLKEKDPSVDLSKLKAVFISNVK